MAKHNKTRYALLGVLTLGPSSGYDIKKFVGESLGHFWQVSYGQVYPMLKRLQAEGLMTVRREIQKERPSRKVYTLTSRGHEEFLRWASLDHPDAPLDKPEILLKTFFGHQIPPAVTIRRLEDCRQRSRELMALFSSIEAQLQAEATADPNLPYWRITLRSGVLHNRATIQWCEESLKALRGGDTEIALKGARP